MRGAIRLVVALFSFGPLNAFPGSAHADPVTFRYAVTVSSVCTTQSCTSTDVSFPLTLKFDPGITFERHSADEHVLQYGAPTFSSVPLALPGAPGALMDRFRFTIDVGVFLNEAWIHSAQAQHERIGRDGDVVYRQHVSLFANRQGLPEIPELTPETFGAFLGDDNADRLFQYFLVGQNELTGEYTSNTLSYLGRATLTTDSAPVPEPATLTLVGTGLGAGAFHRLRKRRQKSQV